MKINGEENNSQLRLNGHASLNGQTDEVIFSFRTNKSDNRSEEG